MADMSAGTTIGWFVFLGLVAGAIFSDPGFWWLVALFPVFWFVVASIRDIGAEERERQRWREEYRRKYMEEHGQDPYEIADGPWEGGED